MEECSTLTSKFAQAAWKFCAYTFIFLFGLNAMWDEPCLWDSEQCFIGYPKHYVSDKIWWYYNLQIGLYISFFIWHFFADKQKDFPTMVLNYIVMLGYLFQTWSINLTLIGSFTMLIHDVVGIFIELAKCLAFMNKHFYSHITIGVFSFLWVLTRFIIFPYRVLYYTLYESLTVLPFVPGYYIQFVFLYSMLILSGVLTTVVLQTTHYKFTTGAVNLF